MPPFLDAFVLWENLPLAPRTEKYSRREGQILGGSHNLVVVENGGIFWEG